ncbi:MAG: family 78 glycoside hydrolase catalytic domain, partial [Clostridia bacterium]|nr:family 78 glycoside hydrolase catalytic domain [Clostridia bacterium]
DITKGALAPYISNLSHYCYYDLYDISDFLFEGENAIGIILGNGFMNAFGGFIWDFEKADWRGAPMVSAELTAESENETFSLITDETFKVHPSPIYFDDLRMGTYFDANKTIRGWNEPAFDDSLWDNAFKAEYPGGEIKLCEADPIRITKEITPVSVTKCREGYIYDFGENNAGVCRLKINAEPGQKIELYHAETLKNGELDVDSTIFRRPQCEDIYRQYGQKDIYIATGSGVEEFVPDFTYHGFRYVLVKGITEKQATKELLTYLVMSSDLRTIGEFHCSDETVNKLFEMAMRSDRSNFYYFPTDCPHREKNGWTGDASMSAAHMMLLYDTTKSWTEWLRNIRKAQTEQGELPGIVPTAGWGYEWGNGPAWDSVLFNLPYQLYKCRGNLEVIKENADAMMKYLEYAMSKRSEDGTIAIGLGDWVPVGKNSSSYDAPLALTDTLMVMDIANKAKTMFNAIGKASYADKAYEIYTTLRATLRNTMIDFDTMTVKGECQSSQAMSLYYGLFEDNERDESYKRLRELIAKNNNSFDCGFLGIRALFHVLSDFGDTELALEMITKKEYPSYGNLIERGETTLVEQFLPEDMVTSHNHHFMGDISRWFIENIAGVKIINSKKAEINIKPPKSIDYASFSYELPSGKISVSWKREGDDIKVDVINNSDAEVIQCGADCV